MNDVRWKEKYEILKAIGMGTVVQDNTVTDDGVKIGL